VSESGINDLEARLANILKMVKNQPERIVETNPTNIKITKRNIKQTFY